MRRPRTFLLCFLVTLLSFLGCSDKPSPLVGDSNVSPPADPAERLAKLYRTRDLDGFLQMVRPGRGRPGAVFFPHHGADCQSQPWSYVELMEVHRRMFTPQDILPPEPPLPADLWLTSVAITLTRTAPYEEATEYYQSATNPGGLDPATYHVTDAMFDYDLLLDLQGDIDFAATGRHRLVFAEDLTRDIEDLAKFTILEWNDLDVAKASQSSGRREAPQSMVEPETWTTLLSVYRVTPPEFFCASRSPEQLIDNLAQSYRELRLEQFKTLMATGSDAPEYEFHLDPFSGSQDEQWGHALETHIHQRMFEPQNTPAGQSPVPAEYWLIAIHITLTQSTPFTERTDLYASAQNPDGLEPTRWKAMDALYATDVLFDTQGDLDFQVTGLASFVVIEDLDKNLGEAGKFLLFQWFDLGNAAKTSAEGTTWSSVKGRYN